MSTPRRGSLVLCGLCWALTLPLAAGAAPTDAPRPPDLSKLPPSTPAAAPAPAPRAAVLPDVQEGQTPRDEPAVRQTVIEDDSARIDELKVRGRSKRITVTPKKGAAAYEIITPNGGPDQTEGPNGTNGAVGKRVWPVLSF